MRTGNSTINLGHRELSRIAMIALCWVAFQSMVYVHEYFSTLDLIQREMLTGSFEFWPNFISKLTKNLFGGVIGGILIVSRKPLDVNRKYLVVGLAGAISLLLLNYLENAIITPSFFAAALFWVLLISATRFMLEISDRFGEGVLWKFLTGQYKSPKEEERIFLFLDLEGSTSIAEKIESRRYFEILKEVYKDITDPIIENFGEIYQYVGDQVVVSWPVAKGVRNNNALRCYFRIEAKILEKQSKYLNKYGFVPVFKAGMHIGKATVGEIGVTKKEIVYSGDVLNTTARIQALCGPFKAKLLVSSPLLRLMEPGAGYRSLPVGEIELRGKEFKIDINAVDLAIAS